MPRTKGAKGKHHKEKPHKEKKQRGRPKGSIKQKQKQHQTVNVKVINNNGGGGGGGGEKKITIPVPFQLPSTVYDPSLVQPHYGINDRQPVNPLTDASTDLMTPMIQSMISNGIISNNPPNPGKPTPPIKQKDVTPVNPVIPKPPEETIKNPQTDQSHPIPPEIIMDSNISSSIHDKHQQHKTIKDMIKPDVPQNIKPPKYVDKEGLGAKIPVQNIGALATTIASGGAYGGTLAAGEALLTGGLTGVLGAGESIAASAVGGGVAAGINNALGGGDVGHVVSGIVGGILGRTTNNRTTRTRSGNRLGGRNIREPPPFEESAPLIPKGNKLGGKAKKSRLVDDEIQEVPQQSIMDNVKRTAQKTMDNITDTIHNLRHQLTGRARKGGTYARLTNTDIKEPRKGGTYARLTNTDIKEPRIINLTDEIMPELNAKAAKIQRLVRRNQQAKMDKEFKQNHEQLLNENQQRFNELDELFKQEHAARISQNEKQKKEAANFLLGKIKVKRNEKGRHLFQKTVQENIKQRKKDAKLENITQQILDDSMKEIKKEDAAAAVLSGLIKRQKARKDYEFEKIVYPAMETKRQQQVKTTQPLSNLQAPPPTKTQFTSSLLDQELQASRARAQQLYQEAKQRNQPLPVSTNLQTGKQQTYKDLIKSGDIERAAAERTMRINEKTMKARQLVNDVQVQELQKIKKDEIKKNAAVKIQKTWKGKLAKENISKIRKAKDKIAGNVKALFTEKANFFKAPKILGNKTIITNKKTVGQPLALNRQLEFVSKKKQAAAKEGYQNRQAFLEMADKYKDIMKKK